MFEYDDDDLVYEINASPTSPSRFDRLLRSRWDNAMEKGHFWYRLDKLETRILPGKYRFVAQLNIKRAQERRKPQHVSSVVMPFNPDLFNFTRVKDSEVLFELRKTDKCSTATKPGHCVVINVSPLEYCNALLVPSLADCLPQVLSPDGLMLAIDAVLLSSSPALRVGFNSLGGFASVNHQHYHLYYLEHRLHLEKARVTRIFGDYHELQDYPAEGFAFQVSRENKEAVVRHIMALVGVLLETSTAHNLFVTRGTAFREGSVGLSVVRVYLWARKSCYGAKDESAFNVALCELGGHLPMKNDDGFRSATEDSVAAVLRDFCHETFVKVRAKMASLEKDSEEASMDRTS
ncbi:GDP-D-glucose phosphorylase 1 [Ixodes scapularis]|uniref:GDP-D-glucose phosphorylase 1 n=1 Tax=Ixodes scapularis TaxID=6945 RepID=UPI001A9FC28D|nr:GDP-D-glucose phosphorylase 1 [Ixodes scapularis]